MPHLPVIPSKLFIAFVEKLGFVLINTRGSHYRFRHPDGRVVTIPVHGKKPISRGLLRKIIREEIEISLEDFLELFEKYL